MTKYRQYFFSNYKTLPIYSIPDQDDNRYSLDRKLRNRLYLIVKSPKTKLWRFPTGLRVNPQHLSTAAILLFGSTCSYGDHKLMFGNITSNCPVAHFQSPTDSLEKTFFFHFVLHPKTFPLVADIFRKKLEGKEWYEDFQWISRQEINDYEFEDENYKKFSL